MHRFAKFVSVKVARLRIAEVWPLASLPIGLGCKAAWPR